MSEDDGRLMVVEERIKTIAADVADMKTTMKDIAASLSTLAVLEVRHNTTAESLNRAFKAITSNSERIDAIERTLPNISLASSWVFKAVIGVVAIGTSAIVSVIFTFFRH